MSNKNLTFKVEESLGRVFRVDTGSVWAESTDPDVLTRLAVGSLIAFQGSKASEFLVGVLDRVSRDIGEALDSDEGAGVQGDLPLISAQRDALRVVLVGTYCSVDGDRRNTFKRGADSYPVIDAPCWPITGTNLRGLMGLLSSQLRADKQLQLGQFVIDPTAKAVADGDRFFQRHAALLGSTGSGKSWSVALLLERANALPHANIIVLDMHGEYQPLTEGTTPIAKGFRIAGPSEDRDEDSALYIPWWVLNQSEMQALLLDRSEDNAPNQAARLSHHVRALKSEYLLSENQPELEKAFTVDSPVPFDLDALVAGLTSDNEERVPGSSGRDINGPYHGKLTRFISRLQGRISDRRFGFMFKPPTEANEYGYLAKFARALLGTEPGIKVIDCSEVPTDVLPIVMGTLGRLLYEIQFWMDDESRTPVAIVCDEAHLYLPANAPDITESRALASFERIAKEGRKYGVSLVVVSQRPADLSRTVLAQCNNFVVLRLTNDRDQRVIKRLIPDSMQGLVASIPLLDVGEALILGDSMVLPTRVRLDEPAVKPASSTRQFWSEWNSNGADDAALTSAVEALRRQTRAR